MSLRELVRDVARVTGETRREIRRRGFQPLTLPAESATDDDAEGTVVDWDELEAERPVLFP
jgi:hypothetical protein